MQSGNVMLIRKHVAGQVKIYDRSYELDKDGKPALDKDSKEIIKNVYHFLGCEAYKRPFEVNDLEKVMARHGAILQEV